MIVSFNTRALTARAIRSVSETVSRHSFEVVVSDNASSDGTVDALRREYPWVRVTAAGANLGFARGVNRALSLARGRYLLLLNSDTTAEPGALDLLIDFLDATPTAGVAAPHLLNADGTDQGTARSFPSPLAVLFGRKSWLTRRFPRNRWSRRYLAGREHTGSGPFRVDWVSGACMLVRRRAIELVGPLDERFFMYWEDADWCRRISRAGFGVYCVPQARVIHDEGQSSHGRRAFLLWTFHRSVYRYYTKHHAPQPWNPLRFVAAVGLYARAITLIAIDRWKMRASIPHSGGAVQVGMR